MKWFRWYHDACEDAKFRVVARNASVTVETVTVTVRDALSVWAALLECASKADQRGQVHVDKLTYIATILDLDDGILDAITDAMKAIHLIELTPEFVVIKQWNKRQFKTDDGDGTNAERQKRYRNAHRNGTVTAQSTDNRIQIEDKVEARTPSAAPTRGSRFPHETPPEPWKQFCREKRPDLDPSATFDRCRDYWIAQPGQRGVKRDWDATWRNWVRNERKQPATAPPIANGGPPPGFREAKSTGEYVEYMRQKLNDPKIEQGDWRLSKWQHVPVGFTPLRKVSA